MKDKRKSGRNKLIYDKRSGKIVNVTKNGVTPFIDIDKGAKVMELKDISGNVIYGGKDDTIKLLENIAEAIIHGGISIDDVRVVNEEIRKDNIRMKQINATGEKWKKISFWYSFENKK